LSNGGSPDNGNINLVFNCWDIACTANYKVVLLGKGRRTKKPTNRICKTLLVDLSFSINSDSYIYMKIKNSNETGGLVNVTVRAKRTSNEH
ncbi:MAG: hypothetical protein AB2653_13200, partial [Candidatus Thiodiazotropha endolucinida]